VSRQSWEFPDKPDIWDRYVFDHHCVNNKYPHTVKANAENWEELMDWCLSNFENNTWCWNHTGGFVEYTLKFLHERDAILARLTWE
jgi:hypothetical protein